MNALPMKKSLGCVIKTCEQHGEYNAESYEGFNGRRILYSTCPECEKQHQARKAVEEEKERAEKELSKIRWAGISQRFIGASFTNFEMVCREATANLKKIKAYSDKFPDIKKNGTSLVLCGRPGTGKTHIASALVINLVKAGISCKYSSSFKIMSRIKSTYDKNNARETESHVIQELAECELLVIDEVGVQFGSETEKILFYQIINGRYDNILPTVLISNLTAEELKKFIGERCFDRLREGGGAVLSFGWDSYRK